MSARKKGEPARSTEAVSILLAAVKVPQPGRDEWIARGVGQIRELGRSHVLRPSQADALVTLSRRAGDHDLARCILAGRERGAPTIRTSGGSGRPSSSESVP